MTLVRCTQEVSVKPFTCSCKCIVRCGLVKWSTVMLSSRSWEEGCSLYITQCCSVVAWVWCPPSIVISSALFTGFSTDWQRTHWHWNSGQHQENKNWKILVLRFSISNKSYRNKRWNKPLFVWLVLNIQGGYNVRIFTVYKLFCILWSIWTKILYNLCSD